MESELKKLVETSENREGLAKIFGHIAERLDEMRRELFPKRAKAADKPEDSEHG